MTEPAKQPERKSDMPIIALLCAIGFAVFWAVTCYVVPLFYSPQPRTVEKVVTKEKIVRVVDPCQVPVVLPMWMPVPAPYAVETVREVPAPFPVFLPVPAPYAVPSKPVVMEKVVYVPVPVVVIVEVERVVYVEPCPQGRKRR